MRKVNTTFLNYYALLKYTATATATFFAGGGLEGDLEAAPFPFPPFPPPLPFPPFEEAGALF